MQGETLQHYRQIKEKDLECGESDSFDSDKDFSQQDLDDSTKDPDWRTEKDANNNIQLIQKMTIQTWKRTVYNQRNQFWSKRITISKQRIQALKTQDTLGTKERKRHQQCG